MKEAIRIKNLSVAYEERQIIENMNLVLTKGKMNIIIGENGRFPHHKMIGGLNAHDKEVIDWAIRGNRTK